MANLASILGAAGAAAAVVAALACGEKREPAPTAPPAPTAAATAAAASSQEAAPAPAAQAPSQLVIDLRPKEAGGVVMSLGERVLASDAELEVEARRAMAASSDVSAVIRPTRETPHGEVVRVMELLKAVGIRRLTIAIGEAEPGAATPASGGR